jgi:hypothetical protein
MINDLIQYPLKGSGKFIIVIGGILYLMLSFLSNFPFIGIVISIISTGFFAAYFFDIVNSTATGKDEPCDFPDIRDFWSDIFYPYLCIVSAVLFSFSPLLILLFILKIQSSLIIYVALIFGFIHFPMAVLNVAISQRALGAFWPYTIALIKRCPLEYAVFVVILGLITIIKIVLDSILLKIPVLGIIIIFLLWMYILMLQGRMMGLFYRDNRTKLR